jgi:hypothetical protein
LEKRFGDAIVIQCQQGQGMSNIVYISSICLSEAIDTANCLKADMKSIRTHDLSDTSSSVCDEYLILHKAIGILRKHIGDLVIESSEYTSPT